MKKEFKGGSVRAEKRVYPERKGGLSEAWAEVLILRPPKLRDACKIGDARCAVGV
jgi:hypothetical protein